MGLNTVNDDKKRKNFRSSRWETELAKKDNNKTTSTQSSTAADVNNLYKTTNQSSTVTTPVITEQPPSSGNVGMGDLKQAEYQSEQPGFFEQKKPLRLNDLYVTPSDRTKAPVYDYKRLDDKPITKKIYKNRVNDPDNREETFPIAQTEETQTGSILPAENTDEKLRQNELMIRGETLAKINSGEIKLPPFVSVLPDNQKLQWVGATYNNNPLYTAISTISTPLINLGNVLNAGIDKVFDTNLGAVEPGNLESEDSGSKLLDYGIELGLNLLPLGASIKGANLLLKGIKSPYLRHMLSSGLGFMINSQPELLDNLTQGKIELKDYAAQNAVDFGTGVTFGMLPLKTKLRYEIPYQSIVPTMVPVLSDIIQGKEVDSEKIIGDAITNGLLGLALSGKLKGGFKVKEVSDKVKRELKGYAEEQITPELVETVIAGYLPPASVENTQTVSRIDRSGEKPVIEQVETPIGRDVIQVDPEGKARLIPEKQAEPMITSETPLGMQRGNVRYDKQGDILPDGMTDAEVKETRNRLRKKVYPETPEVTQRIEGETELISEPENVKGVKITADPKAEIELRKEEERINEDLRKKYNKEVIPEISSDILINTQSGKVSERVNYLNEAIREHNKQFEKPAEPETKPVSDGRTQQLEAVNERINELQDNAKTITNKNEARKISERIERLQEQRDLLEKGMRDDGISIEKQIVKSIVPEVKATPELAEKNIKNKISVKEEIISEETKPIGTESVRTEPVKTESNTTAEKVIIENPRSEIPKVISEKIKSDAENKLDEIKDAETVRQGSINTTDPVTGESKGTSPFTISSFPKWFSELGQNKKSVMNALNKIIEDQGKDKGLIVERVKAKILEHLAEGKQDSRQYVIGGEKKISKGDYTPPDKEVTDFLSEFKNNKVTKEDLLKWEREQERQEKEYLEAERQGMKDTEPSVSEVRKDVMQIKSKNIPKVPEKKAEFNAETEAKRREFEKMTLGQLERHIVDKSSEMNSRLKYEQTPEFKELVKPLYDKLTDQRMKRIKEEISFEKEKYQNKLISKDQYYAAKRSIIERGSKMYSNPLDPSVFKDLTVVGLYHLERGLVKATDWARQMIKEFGEKIKPYLKKIWNEINDPKNVRKFREDNPEAKLFTSGIDKMKLREKDGEPETFAQYSVRIAKEYGRASTREEYQDAKEYYRTSKNQPQKEIKPESDDKVKQELKETLNDIERMRLDADRTKTSRPTPEEEIAKYKDKKNKKKQERNFIEKTIGKIPEYEEKYTGNEYDKQEKVTQEIRKNLFADENFKALNSDQKRKVVKAVDSYYKERNKNDMNFDNELGKEYKETLWNKAWKRGVKQAIKVVENMGEAGKEMASRFKKMSDEERKWMGKPSEMVLDLGKLSKEEYNNLKEIRTWKRLQPSLTEKESATKTGPQKSVTENQKKLPLYLNENVKAADKLLDDYYDSVASEFEGRGFLTKNKDSGKIYLFTPRRDYEPRVLNVDMDKFGIVYDKTGKPIHNIEREKVLTHMVQTGQAKNKADAAYTLDNYIAESRINKAGNIEYSRTFDFPEEYYLNDPIEVMIKYATRTSKRLAFSDSFGKDGAIADRLIDEMRNNMHDYKFVQDLYRYETGNLNASERQVLEYVNLAKGLQAMTKFTPFTTLRNSFQGLLGSSTRGNLKAGITGLMKAFVPAVKREAYLSGALGDNIESIIKESAGGDSNNLVGKMTSKYLNLIGFTASDRFNRVVSSAAGITFYEDMLKRIGNNSVLKKRAIREFQTIGLDPQEILSRPDKKFTQEERNLIMRTFSGDTQFNIRPQDLPLFWSSGIGKLVTQWKPFGYKMTQLIRDSVWKETKSGNLFPLLTMMTAYGVAGESVNTVIDGLRSVFNYDPNKKDDSEDKMQSVYNKTLLAKFKEGDLGGFTKRLVDDLAGLGAMTMMVDILRSFGWGKSGAVGVVAGPTVGEITQTADDILRPTGELFRGEEEDWFNNTLKGVYNTASRNIPGSGILRTFGVTKAGRDALFKNKTTSDEFKETLNDDELKKYEEINSLTKKRDSAKKKAIKTNDQKDKDEYRNLEKELAFIKSKSGNIYGKKNKFDYEKKKQENKILNK